MIPPAWALTLVYWLHMLATVTWIGGLAALSILVLPAARITLEPQAYQRFLEALQHRLDPLGWFCLVLLGATGMLQMSANPNYHGFLEITNRWAVAILLKHILILGMVVISAYLTWGVLPQLRRAALRRAAGNEPPERDRLANQEVLLLRVNLLFGVIVLALTAWARAA